MQVPNLPHVAESVGLYVTAPTDDSEGPEEGYSDMENRDIEMGCVIDVHPDVSDTNFLTTENKDSTH